MPELPDVVSYLVALRPRIVGQRLAKIQEDLGNENVEASAATKDDLAISKPGHDSWTGDA